ncbi:NADP-dependent L-serine/L-allo-threonine dehydrogenase ydfG [Schizosaccharomyces japonicus yFS275]|uniref:NADP-dependent L-serine/L-allo-threonine dehydrogenase ydfG n=1 Tax=Schizosaccharomyces japonicus (strain yFS275 / FY16936) TaxID=402676 RepID=B6JZ27_SCHJY|nr:NADP-dependent L-serine/L-allo-threonine dehydrogenase ydfG [Schizosaccharomyces japonicus yFS275]EEB06795.1 NADP-dependent L-serine/L-allo-threonine dehydrogenase ydfG [Schizosaccharomyces japonicus yFS275]
MSNLDGKTILITGASAGIGKATAIEIAKTGKAKLILAARRVAVVEELKAELESKYEGVKVLPLKLDVSNVEEVESTIGTLPKEFSHIDVLINNAGLALGLNYFRNMDMQDAIKVVNTNIIGLIAVTKAVIRIFYENGGHGDIVNVSSIAGHEPYPTGSVYCCTKAAVSMFTSTLRQETIDTRIRVMEIDPGMVDTEFATVITHGDKVAADKFYEGYEALKGKDIGELIVFGITRRENFVLAQATALPSSQSGCTAIHRESK